MKFCVFFIFAMVLFNGLSYGLMPSYKDDAEVLYDEKKELTVKKEKRDLMKNVSRLRDKRAETLHPFVLKSPVAGAPDEISHDIIKEDTVKTNIIKPAAASGRCISGFQSVLIFFSAVFLIFIAFKAHR
jgi:hypothetical protein